MARERRRRLELPARAQPDVYLAWLYASDDPDQIFSGNVGYSRVVVEGDVDVVLYSEETFDFIQRIDRDGVISYEPHEGEATSIVDEAERPDVFMLRAGGRTVCVLPDDVHYGLFAHSTDEQDISFYKTHYTVNSVQSQVSSKTSMTMPADDLVFVTDLLTVAEDENLEIEQEYLEEYFTGYREDELAYSPGLLTRLENINVFGLTWTQVLVVALVAATLLVGAVVAACVLLSRRHARKVVHMDLEKRPTPAPRAHANALVLTIVAIVACFVVSVLAANRFGTADSVRLFFKVTASALVALVGVVAALRTRWTRDVAVALGLILCVVGDALLNVSQMGGIAAFAAAHLVFCVTFIVDERPSAVQVVVWVAAVAVAVAAGMQMQGTLGSLTIPVIVYAALLLALLVFGWRQPPIVRLAIVLFIASDAMTAYLALHGQSALRTLELGVYYLAIFLIAYEMWRRSFGEKPKRILGTTAPAVALAQAQAKAQAEQTGEPRADEPTDASLLARDTP